jgi:hypothetical protein
MASTGLERKAHRPLGSEHPGQSRGMDIARTILATSLDRRKADRTTVKCGVRSVFLGGDGATTGHTLREGQKVNGSGHQAGNLGMDIGPDSA